MIHAQSVPDVAVLSEAVEGLQIGSLLALEINPLWGYAFMAVGLALCLAGYILYRLMVALAAAVSGGAVVYILGPGFTSLEGTALWTTVVGGALVLFVVGWLLYQVGVFLMGAVAGLAMGVSFWLLGSGKFTGLTDLTSLTITREELPAVVATALLPALAIGIVAVAWERRLITLIAVVLGAMVFALGLRYSDLPDVVLEWGPVLAGAAMALGLFLNSRPRHRETTE